MSDIIVVGTPAEGGTIDIAELKAWLRIEHDRDDTELQDAILAAELFIENECGIDLATDPPDRLLAVVIKQIAGTFYENRESAAPVKIEDLPIISRILTQYRGVII